MEMFHAGRAVHFSIYRGSMPVCELNSEAHSGSHNNFLELRYMNITAAQNYLTIKQGLCSSKRYNSCDSAPTWRMKM